MATGLHVATVAFSVRNVLAMHEQPKSAADICRFLRANWDQKIEMDEVAKAVAELLAHGLIAQEDGGGELFRAVDPRPFASRGANGRLELAPDDPRAWEGWQPRRVA